MESSERGALILIVDDNPTNLDILVEILQDDYRLGVAKSGEKALEFVDHTTPDLILLDILMPDLNGFEVCEILKSSEKTKDIPVIFISAADNLKDVSRGMAVGAVDFLTKPFLADEIKERVDQQLGVIQ
jgi:cyclic di-GMP phosphodiesterase